MSLSKEKGKLMLKELPVNVLFAAVKKMTAVPLIRLRMTCKYLNDFVEEHNQKLSKRIFENSEEQKTSLWINFRQKRGKGELVDIDFYWYNFQSEKLARCQADSETAAKFFRSGIPIHLIDMGSTDSARAKSTIINVYRKYSILCNILHAHMFFNPKLALEFLESILEHAMDFRVQVHDHEHFGEELDVLQQSRKKEQLTIFVTTAVMDTCDFLSRCTGFKEVFVLRSVVMNNSNALFKDLHLNGARNVPSLNLSGNPLTLELDPSLNIKTLWSAEWISDRPDYSRNYCKYILTMEMGEKVGLMRNNKEKPNEYTYVEVIQWEQFSQKVFSLFSECNIISNFIQKEAFLEAHRVGDGDLMKQIVVKECNMK